MRLEGMNGFRFQYAHATIAIVHNSDEQLMFSYVHCSMFIYTSTGHSNRQELIFFEESIYVLIFYFIFIIFVNIYSFKSAMIDRK